MKSIKKLLSGTLALLLATGTVSFSGIVYATELESVAENDIQIEAMEIEAKEDIEIVPTTGKISGSGWEMDEAGVLTLLANVSYVEGQPYEWEQYAEEIKEIIVAEGVTEIPAVAFSRNYTNLKKVTMSSTIETIGLGAFSKNTNLTEVILNDGLKSVGIGAFSETGITSIVLPAGVTWYSDVFTYCQNLSGTITIPVGSKWVGNAQFYGTGVETVIIEEGVTEIANQFLNGCENLKYVWIPQSLTDIGEVDIENDIWDSPIPASCIIGYKGTMAEKYVNHWLEMDSDWTKGMTFHAIDGEDHTFGEWQMVQNATCTDKGMMKHTCTICNAERTQEVLPLGHQWDEGKVTQVATENAEGIKTYTCTICNETKTEVIAKLTPSPSGDENSDKNDTESQKASEPNHINSPKTGDDISVLTWLQIMAISAVVLTFSVVKRRGFRS